MSFKVVKNQSGVVVVWGPNDDNYAPTIPTGCVLSVEAAAPTQPWAPIKAAEIAAYIETREKMCARVAGIGQRLARAGDTVGAASCDAVVNALLDVPAHTSVVNATDLASLRLALKDRYLAAVGLASASAKAEFKRYDK